MYSKDGDIKKQVMQYAKSMYLGGELVQAEDCDFKSSKQLGLTCPFCSQAVFLRAGHIRTTQEKEVLVSAAFAHYHTGVDDFDCEKRSLSAEGREFLRLKAIEARNQRLDLYNKRLWEMISRDRNIKRTRYLSVKKAIGESRLALRTKEVREWLSNNQQKAYELVEKVFDDFSKGSTLNVEKPILMSEEDHQEELRSHKEYISSCDKKLDLAVSQEVIDFLCTRTGGYALEKLTAVGFWVGFVTAQLKPDSMDTETLSIAIISTIAGTRWTKILQNYL